MITFIVQALCGLGTLAAQPSTDPCQNFPTCPVPGFIESRQWCKTGSIDNASCHAASGPLCTGGGCYLDCDEYWYAPYLSGTGGPGCPEAWCVNPHPLTNLRCAMYTTQTQILCEYDLTAVSCICDPTITVGEGPCRRTFDRYKFCVCD